MPPLTLALALAASSVSCATDQGAGAAAPTASSPADADGAPNTATAVAEQAETDMDPTGMEIRAVEAAIEADHARLETLVTTKTETGVEGLHRSEEVQTLADRLNENRQRLRGLKAQQRAAQR